MFLTLDFQTNSANPISSGREIPMTILESRIKTTVESLPNCKKIPIKLKLHYTHIEKFGVSGHDLKKRAHFGLDNDSKFK